MRSYAIANNKAIVANSLSLVPHQFLSSFEGQTTRVTESPLFSLVCDTKVVPRLPKLGLGWALATSRLAGSGI